MAVPCLGREKGKDKVFLDSNSNSHELTNSNSNVIEELSNQHELEKNKKFRHNFHVFVGKKERKKFT
jgi:hypothetical protein